MINIITQEEIDKALALSREPRKINHFNVIIKETVPFIDLVPPIHEAAPPNVTMMHEIHHTAWRNITKVEIDEGCFIYENEDGVEVTEPDPESFIRIKVGNATLDIREDNESRSHGGFFVDTPCDDFYFNLGGVSTTLRGPLERIAHFYNNRGSAWAGHTKCHYMGYCFYLAYQLSHELKKGQRKGN